MQKSMYDPLTKLDKSKSTWRIKVRVMRMWPTQNSEKNKFSGFNLILCDEDVSTCTTMLYFLFILINIVVVLSYVIIL